MANRRASLGNGPGPGASSSGPGSKQAQAKPSASQQQALVVPFYPPAPPKRPADTRSWAYWVGGQTCLDMNSLYEVKSELGRPGAYGYAVLASRRSDNSQVAVKVRMLPPFCL